MKKYLVLTILIALGVAGFWGYKTYQKVYGPNLNWPENRFLYVATGSSFKAVQDSLAPFLTHTESFEWVAQQKNYTNQIKPGRYALNNNMSNNALVNKLRSGDQEPLDLVIFGLKNTADLAQFLGTNLEYDSAAYFEAYTSSTFLKEYKLKPVEVLGQFIPNTYQFYWNASPKYTLTRMIKEADKFWQPHQRKLEALQLSRHEVITLASIVESETIKADEMPTVAGLYLNRLKRGIKLQSDPTVLYGIYKSEPKTPTIKRVLFKHLKHESAYNTYLNAGLPPGPIKLPSVTAIKAVLNAQKHDYIFMVANPQKPGYHSFAKNLSQHNRNRAKYIQWVRKQ